ncbi:hypothetical protein ACFL6I_13970, partial [candidate division KSB1 bacterium]
LTDEPENLSANNYLKIKKLGKSNLIHIIRDVNREINNHKSVIGNQHSRIEMSKNLTAEKLREGCEDPRIPENTIVRGHPIRLEDILRKSGTTTFYTCGWCDYNGSSLGNLHGNYKTNGKCYLLLSVDHDYEAFQSSDYGINHECEFIKRIESSEKNREEVRVKLIQGSQKVISQREEELKRWNSILSMLENTYQKSEEKVLIPEFRAFYRRKPESEGHHFNEGDRIMFFSEELDEMVGAVIHTPVEEGHFMFYADKKFYNYNEGRNIHPSGRIGIAYERDYDVLLPQEFEYLTRNKDFARLWLGCVKGSFGSIDHTKFEKFARIILGEKTAPK